MGWKSSRVSPGQPRTSVSRRSRSAQNFSVSVPRATLSSTWSRCMPNGVLRVAIAVAGRAGQQHALDVEPEQELVGELVRRERQLFALVHELLHERVPVFLRLRGSPGEVEG